MLPITRVAIEVEVELEITLALYICHGNGDPVIDTNGGTCIAYQVRDHFHDASVWTEVGPFRSAVQ